MEKWKSAFFRFLEQTISKRKPRTNKPQTNPWFNSFLAGMIRRRICLFRCACQSNFEEMWRRYRESRNRVTSALRSTRHRYYMHKAALLMKPVCPSAKWWTAAKELTGQTVDVKGVPPLQDTKGSFVYDEFCFCLSPLLGSLTSSMRLSRRQGRSCQLPFSVPKAME